MKFAKDRLVPFGPRLEAKLAEHLGAFEHEAGERSQPNSALFSFRAGRAIHPCTIAQTFHQVVTADPAFVPPPGVSAPKLHCLRHSFAVGTLLRWYRAGVDVSARLIRLSPTKRTPPPRTRFLQRDEVEALFKRLPSSGPRALRDHTLLLFLCNTGARVQEVADLRVRHLDLKSNPRVRLHGKGDKWRVCPLWALTASRLRELIAERIDDIDEPVFVSASGRALTRFGIYKIGNYSPALESCLKDS